MSLNNWTDERLTRAALGSLLRFGATSVLALASRYGPDEAWQRVRAGVEVIDRQPDDGDDDCRVPSGDAFAAWANATNPREVADSTEQAGLRFLIPSDPEWPMALGELEGCAVGSMGGVPVGLWAAGPGRLASWSRKSVAMVGARAATRYGESVALDMASNLAGEVGEPHWTIVSGGAFGIDSASHRGALLMRGHTIGVYAGGLDSPYPPGNYGLFKDLVDKGLVISELPPGAAPTRHGFLERNRLIAALSQGTVVVEAALRSGARNTATWAGELGRIVMAVPGPVTSSMSTTPHRLIRDGEAVLVSQVADIRAMLQPVGQGDELPLIGARRDGDDLVGDVAAVREALPGRGGKTLSEMVLLSGVTITSCLDALSQLASRGFAMMDDQGRWRAVRNAQQIRQVDC
ncbi:MAG: DNA-protecting protein DprA [Propionibacteriaceae bacterium]|nr:DNA-protecting protein DprA [Propionibacteriaceae bacterium]